MFKQNLNASMIYLQSESVIWLMELWTCSLGGGVVGLYTVPWPTLRKIFNIFGRFFLVFMGDFFGIYLKLFTLSLGQP